MMKEWREIMIQVSKIDDKLTIYRENEIVIWGAGESGKYIYSALTYFGIQVRAFCDSDEAKWGQTLFELPVISPSELEALYTTSKIMVQIGVGELFQAEVIQCLKQLHITNFIMMTEAVCRLTKLKLRNLGETAPLLREKTAQKQMSHLFAMENVYGGYLHLFHSFSKEILFICAPAKVGNVTLMEVLRREKIPYHNFWHAPAAFDKALYGSLQGVKVKIITSVRDPIAQNLSLLYQTFKDVTISSLINCKEFWEKGGGCTSFI